MVGLEPSLFSPLQSENSLLSHYSMSMSFSICCVEINPTFRLSVTGVPITISWEPLIQKCDWRWFRLLRLKYLFWDCCDCWLSWFKKNNRTSRDPIPIQPFWEMYEPVVGSSWKKGTPLKKKTDVYFPAPVAFQLHNVYLRAMWNVVGRSLYHS